MIPTVRGVLWLRSRNCAPLTGTHCPAHHPPAVS